MATQTAWVVTVITAKDLWCEACSTSGGVRVRVYRLRVDGVKYLGTAHACYTCRSKRADEG